MARWAQLADKVVQLAQVSKGGRGKEGGVSKAARELNIPRDEVTRAVKIASLTDDAKAVATERGLDDNQSALLEAAKVKPEARAELPPARRLRRSRAHRA